SFFTRFSLGGLRVGGLSTMLQTLAHRSSAMVRPACDPHSSRSLRYASRAVNRFNRQVCQSPQLFPQSTMSPRWMSVSIGRPSGAPCLATTAGRTSSLKRGPLGAPGCRVGRPGVLVVELDVRGLLDLEEELGVAPGLAEAVQEQLDTGLGVQGGKHSPELPHYLELVGTEEDLLLAGAGVVDVDGREDPTVRQLPVELELHVAGALELLEDHLVHARAGLHERSGQDRQRSAVLDVAGGTEELLRRVERGAVDTTGEDP